MKQVAIIKLTWRWKCKPIGIGSFAGQNVMSNDDFQSLVDTNDAWISKRTGIRRRHMLTKGML